MCGGDGLTIGGLATGGFAGEQWTLEAIGKELGLTRERVRQIEARALTRLQHQLKDVVRAEGGDVVLAA